MAKVSLPSSRKMLLFPQLVNWAPSINKTPPPRHVYASITYRRDVVFSSERREIYPFVSIPRFIRLALDTNVNLSDCVQSA